MLSFLLGLLIGGAVGIIVMALMTAAAAEDRWMDEHHRSLEEE